MSNTEDFVIEYGILTKYQGPGGDVIIPEGITEIADNAFEGCDSVTSIVIPEGVVRIGYAAFCECRNLTTIILPEGLKEIDDEAFLNCAALECLALPNSLTEIRSASFFFEGGRSETCDIGLTEFVVNEDHPVFSVIDGILYSKDGKKLILCPIGRIEEVEIPNGVTEIGDFAFASCNRLEGVTLPETLEVIGEGAFQCCYNSWKLILPESLVDIGDIAFYWSSGISFSVEDFMPFRGHFFDIIIPQNVKHIGEEAFAGTNPEWIFLPESVTDIGKYSFIGIEDSPCSDFTIFGAPGGIAEKYAEENGFTFEVFEPKE